MAVGTANETIYLVDAHSLIFQVFHAIPEMSSPSGLPTNALFGFTRDMLFLRGEKKPDYLVCAFDLPGKTFRDGIFPDYKAHRAPSPVDLDTQIPQIYRLLEAMHIPIVTKEGYEADDVIATIAVAAAKRELNVFVCTNDKDCRQLIDDRVQLFNLRKHTSMDRAALLEDWGVTPEQVVDLQALVGDSVDNVPGVPGIGLKTASTLLQQYQTVDSILANIDRIPGQKRQENLRAAVSTIPLSRRLVRLATDVPVDLNWEGWKVRNWDARTLLALFQEWGFRSFADQVRSQSSTLDLTPEEPPHVEREAQQGELFPFGANLSDSVERNGEVRRANALYHLVDTPEKFGEFRERLCRQTLVAVDVETTDLDPLRSEIVGIAFSWRKDEAYYLPLRAPRGEPALDRDSTLAQLASVLADPKIQKVSQNIKFDLLALRAQRLPVANVAGDPMLADYLLHAGERSHSIDELALRYLNHRVIPITDLIGKNGKKQLSLDQVSAARVAEYSGEDADLAWQLSSLLESKLSAAGLDGLYRDVELPLIEVLAELQYNGISIDVALLNQQSREMVQQLASIEKRIYELAGRSFNIASPRQLREVLFQELNLPAQKRTGITGEASTDQGTLERLAALGHELPKKIIEHRQIAKLRGTYVDALPSLINPNTGRIHASFNQTVAATGRLSSSDPNLQNIPVRTEQGRQIRQAFLPAKGWLLLTADYSQIELRLLAHFCGDEVLRKAFADDHDIHTLVAAQIFGVPEDEVTSDMRRNAKTVNFGVIYGMSAVGLAQRLGIPKPDAGSFIDAYFARYPKVQEYQTRLLQNCRRNRYVSTILGRRREISGIRANSTYHQRSQPEREAINMEIQGSAADLIKMAMLNIFRRFRREEFESRMLLQIHDELVFEVPPAEMEDVVEAVRHEMTTPLEESLRLEVPLKVDLASGPNWLDVEETKQSVLTNAVTA
jgi:DNA polymerase-1